MITMLLQFIKFGLQTHRHLLVVCESTQTGGEEVVNIDTDSLKIQGINRYFYM